ncbi:MAG: type IV secretion system protein [Campylobacterales bacterium]|nr:type IV secretion system protein [Campylobacterales bacterium]
MKRLLFVALLLLPIFCFADITGENQSSSLLATFSTASDSWRAVILPSAMWLLGTLLTISLIWDVGLNMLSNGLDFNYLVFSLIRFTIIGGFFLALLQYPEWLSSIPLSFSALADKANGGTPIDPDSILDYGLMIVGKLWDGISVFALGDSLIIVIVGIVLIIAFAIMAAQLISVMVKIYVILALAPLAFSLGGLAQTRQIAANPFFAIIKAGAELMLIKLFMGLILTKMANYADKINNDNGSLLTMVAVAIIMVTVTQMIGGIVESVFSGSLAATSISGASSAASLSGEAIQNIIKSDTSSNPTAAKAATFSANAARDLTIGNKSLGLEHGLDINSKGKL